MKIIKYISIALIILVLVGFVLYNIIDFGFKQPCPPPDKPKGIPTEAIWNGGCDGGHWIELVEIKGNKYRFRIYLDYKAEVLMDADFKLEDNCPLPSDSILELISVVEIDKIDVKIGKNKSCLMKPIYPAYGGSSWEIIKEKGEY